MTIVVVIADPPVDGAGVCEEIVAETELTPADGVELYAAVLKDVFTALAESTVDVLINYPPREDLPEGAELQRSPEAILRGLAGSVVDPDRLEDFRFEVQVGSDFSATAGNAITHLLREEERASASVLRPCVPRLVRSIVDEAAIKLRRTDVVLGPAGGGDVYFAGFTQPIDFAGVFEESALEEIAARAGADGLTVDFVRDREVLDAARDLGSVVTRFRAQQLAGKPVPTHVWSFIEDRGLEVRDGRLRVQESTATDSS